MLLPDFIASSMFKSRNDRVSKQEVTRLVDAIEGIIDTFKKVIEQIESSQKPETRVMKINFRTDDTFN